MDGTTGLVLDLSEDEVETGLRTVLTPLIPGGAGPRACPFADGASMT